MSQQDQNRNRLFFGKIERSCNQNLHLKQRKGVFGTFYLGIKTLTNEIIKMERTTKIIMVYLKLKNIDLFYGNNQIHIILV